MACGPSKHIAFVQTLAIAFSRLQGEAGQKHSGKSREHERQRTAGAWRHVRRRAISFFLRKRSAPPSLPACLAGWLAWLPPHPTNQPTKCNLCCQQSTFARATLKEEREEGIPAGPPGEFRAWAEALDQKWRRGHFVWARRQEQLKGLRNIHTSCARSQRCSSLSAPQPRLPLPGSCRCRGNSSSVASQTSVRRSPSGPMSARFMRCAAARTRSSSAGRSAAKAAHGPSPTVPRWEAVTRTRPLLRLRTSALEPTLASAQPRSSNLVAPRERVVATTVT